MMSQHHLMPQIHVDEDDQEAPELSLAQMYAHAIRAELALLAPEARKRFCQSWLERLTQEHPAYEMRQELLMKLS